MISPLNQLDILPDPGFPPVSLRLSETFEDIVANNPHWKIERSGAGETVFMSPTGGGTGARNSEINLQLGNWARQNGGVVFDSSTLFRLPNQALRSPDAAWIQTERWQLLDIEERESYPPLAPDFVIELRSRTDRLIDLEDKLEEYKVNGVRLGWLIDPLLKRVHVYRSHALPVILDSPQSFSDEIVLPGFLLDFSSVFN